MCFFSEMTSELSEVSKFISSIQISRAPHKCWATHRGSYHTLLPYISYISPGCPPGVHKSSGIGVGVPSLAQIALPPLDCTPPPQLRQLEAGTPPHPRATEAQLQASTTPATRPHK